MSRGVPPCPPHGPYLTAHVTLAARLTGIALLTLLSHDHSSYIYKILGQIYKIINHDSIFYRKGLSPAFIESATA
jgi:hypothetical protein